MTAESSLKQKNLEALDSRYFDDTEADEGLERLLTIKEPELGRVLRSHLVDGVGSGHTIIRDSVDDLLSYVGILELGAMTGAIPWPLPTRFARRLRRALALPSVRRYYELFYPLLLPTLFRWRLEDKPLVSYGAFDREVGYFQEFQRLSDTLAEPEVESFLWCLDDGSAWDPVEEEWIGLSDFFQVLTRPGKLVQHLGTTRDASPLNRSVHGFSQFLGFADSLDHILGTMTGCDLLRSALWQFHAYWFYQLSGQVGGVIAASVEEFRRYVEDRPSGQAVRQRRALIRETHAMMDRSQLALRRLTSSTYRGPLEVAYFGRVLGGST